MVEIEAHKVISCYNDPFRHFTLKSKVLNKKWFFQSSQNIAKIHKNENTLEKCI